MKDLYVLTADADAEALLRSILMRHTELEIHPITYEIHRFPGRDSGMVKQGPEIARVLANKTDYSRLLLIWDHHGSGWESRSSEIAVQRIQARLDGVTWVGRSSAIVLVPELEEWLWHCPQSIRTHLGMKESEFIALTEKAALELEKSLDYCRQELPKELFQTVLYSKKRRRPLPEDFKILGASADVARLSSSNTFARLTSILQEWFPMNLP
jgi:hypothetical protein